MLAGMQRVEIGDTLHAEHHGLAVEQEPFLAELTRRHGWIQKDLKNLIHITDARRGGYIVCRAVSKRASKASSRWGRGGLSMPQRGAESRRDWHTHTHTHTHLPWRLSVRDAMAARNPRSSLSHRSSQ